MSSNVKSTPVSRKVDAHQAALHIKWVAIPFLFLVGYISLCVWSAHTRSTYGMAETVDTPFGEWITLGSGLPDLGFLVDAANRGDFLIANWFWFALVAGAITARIIWTQSSFLQGYRNS